MVRSGSDLLKYILLIDIPYDLSSPPGMASFCTRVCILLWISSLCRGTLLKQKCANTTWNLIGDFCYYFESTSKLDQNAAEASCKADSSHLTSITSLEENNAVFQKIKEKGNSSRLFYYIGYDDVQRPGHYMWKDGYVGNYTNFESTARTQDCVALASENIEGKWKDVLCTTPLHFICKKAAIKIFDCAERQFICADGTCINHSRLCDGTADCKEGDDEQLCSIRKNEDSSGMLACLAVVSILMFIFLGTTIYTCKMLRSTRRLRKRENEMRPQQTRATNAYSRPNESSVIENKKRKMTPYPRTQEEQNSGLKFSKRLASPLFSNKEQKLKTKEKKSHAVARNFNNEDDDVYANDGDQFAFNRKQEGKIKRKNYKQPADAMEDEQVYANVPVQGGDLYANDDQQFVQGKKYRYFEEDNVYANG